MDLLSLEPVKSPKAVWTGFHYLPWLAQNIEGGGGMSIDYFCSTRHSGRTLTVGQGNYLSRYLRYALKQKARSFVVV